MRPTLLTALFILSTNAHAGDGVWDQAFPQGSSWGGEDHGLQLLLGGGEVAAGLGLGTYAGFNIEDLKYQNAINNSSFEVARDALRKSDPKMSKLLDARDAAAENVSSIKDQIASIESELKYGRSESYTESAYNFQTGRWEQRTGTRMVELSPAERVTDGIARDKLLKDLGNAKTEASKAASAAAPAEKALDANIKQALANIKAGKIGPVEAKMLRHAKMRLFGESLAVAGSAYMVIDGGLRAYNAWNDRDNGISPVIRLGKTVADRTLNGTPSERRRPADMRSHRQSFFGEPADTDEDHEIRLIPSGSAQ